MVSRLLERDRIERSLLLSMLGHVSVLVGGALVSIILARHYGRDVFGRWAAALVFAQLTGTVVEGGLGRILMREAARNPGRAGAALSLALRGRVLLGAVAVPTALLGAWFFFDGNATAALLTSLLVCGRFVEGLQSSYHAVLLALGVFRLPNLVQLAQRIARVILVMTVALLGAGIEWAALGLAALPLATLYGTARLARPVVRTEPSGPLLPHLRDAFWFWIGGVLFWINAEVDQLMLSQTQGDGPTGTYAAALRLVAMFLVVPRLVSDSVIPRLFRSAPRSAGRANRDMNATAFVLTSLGALVAANLFHFSPELIKLVYTPEYHESGPVLAVLGLFVVLHFARSAPNWFLSTSDRVRTNAALLAIAAATNVGANLLLIPRLGALGAALATVASEALLLALALVWAAWITDRSVVGAVIAGLAPGLLLASLLQFALARTDRIALLGASTLVSCLLAALVLYAVRRQFVPFSRS